VSRTESFPPHKRFSRGGRAKVGSGFLATESLVSDSWHVISSVSSLNERKGFLFEVPIGLAHIRLAEPMQVLNLRCTIKAFLFVYFYWHI
jgi:hypothetical protein